MRSPTAAELEVIQREYDAGRFLSAYRAAEGIGDPAQWTGTPARILGGRLLRHVGDGPLGARQQLRAYRWDPADPEARYYFLFRVLENRGPLEAWARFRRFGLPPEDRGELHGDSCALAGRLLSLMRDFPAAEEWFRRCEAPSLARGWLASEWCDHLVRQDRYEEALEAGSEALRRMPGHWTLVVNVAHAEMLTGREESALDRLASAAREGECGYVAMEWSLAATEMERYGDALEALQRVEALSPRCGKELSGWIRRQRAFLLYRTGRHPEAAAEARAVEDAEYWTPFAERLEKPDPAWKRVTLPVPFTRQHHVTCVPATLTTISRFWNRPAEHLQVAEAICYDGTPSHSERNWAETNGWVAREFTVTLGAARDLLDRGLPFCLTTVHPANAHEQAVIGYDEWRRSLLIRDPWFRNRYDIEVGAFLKSQAASGPRGMAMVPADRGALLDGVELPDAELYDLLHACSRALDTHDRGAAVAAVEALEAKAPGHRLARQGRRALAAYDANTPALLGAIDHLLELFPEDANLMLGRINCLRELAPRSERLRWLAAQCSRQGSDALLWQELGFELSTDAREHASALRCLRRARRVRGADAVGAHTWAGICWASGDFEEALELYRLAACLAEKREGFWQSYFRAAVAMGRTGGALARLEERFERLGGLSDEPTRTLAWAYHQLDRSADAAAVVTRALERRPEDGGLLLYAADDAILQHRVEEAAAFLDRARSLVSANAWRRVAARLAARRHDPVSALAEWRAILEAEPLAIDAHREIAGLLAQLEGRDAAKAHLAAAVGRFPHHVPLRTLRVEWLRDEPAKDRLEVVTTLVASEPEDAWARRERALILSALRRHAEAVGEAELAVRLEPSTSSGHGILGQVLAAAGERERAMECCRAALRLSVDNTFAQDELMGCCTTLEQRQAAVRFIGDELARQTTTGAGLLHFLDLARPFLERDPLLKIAEEAHAARPDLWAAWVGLVRELRAVGRLWDAREVAQKGLARFPLVLRLAVELAGVHRARMEPAEEIAALERVRALEPGWGWAMRELADARLNQGDVAGSMEVLEQAVRHSPDDPFNWGFLGAHRHRAGLLREAVEALSEAVRLHPGYEQAWDRLAALGPEARDPDVAVRLARELTERRPAEARSWTILARVLPTVETTARLEALDRAISLVPDSEWLWRQRASVLLDAGRFDEAAACCRPPVFGDHPPTGLRAMAATVEARRGRRAEAILAMRGALDEDPSLGWGWRELAGWLFEERRLDEALVAAQHVERLSPGDPVAHGYSAAIRLEKGDKLGALELLRRAHELDAGYVWAGMRLLELHLERKELPDAARTLERLRGHLPECRFVEGEIDIAFGSLAKPPVRPLVERLLRAPGDQPDAFARVAKRLVDARMADQAFAWSAGVLREGGTLNPSAGAFLVHLWRGIPGPGAERAAEYLGLLDLLVEGSELARRAWLAHLEHLAERPGGASNAARREAREQILARASRLRGDDLLWGCAGYALVNIGENESAVAWLSDWREHPGLQPWMFHNLICAYLALGREQESREAIAASLTFPVRDHTYVMSRLWAALDAAAQGDWTLASEVAEIAPEAMLSEKERSMRKFLAGFAAWRRGGAAGPGKEAEAEAFKRLREKAESRVIRGWIHRAVRNSALKGGGFGNRVRLLARLAFHV